MNMEVVKTETGLGELVQHQLTKQQIAWIGLANGKNKLMDQLTKDELNAQALLCGEGHEQIDANLAAYRKAHTEMIERRKEYTNAIDAGIVQPLMAFEKRVDPKTNQAYADLAALSLSLRKQAEAKAATTNARNAETAAFKAHCQNEFFRVCAEYRTAIRAEIVKQYAYWLEIGTPCDIAGLKANLLLIQVPPVKKFIASYLTPEEMGGIYGGIPKPDYASVYVEMMSYADETFAHFNSDLANKTAAVAHVTQNAALESQAEARQVNEDIALNTLIATAETVVIDTPKIKRTLVITVVESEGWAKQIMTAFITNLPSLGKYIKVKSWAKLSIGQMAEYLSKYSTDEEKELPGLKYETKEA